MNIVLIVAKKELKFLHEELLRIFIIGIFRNLGKSKAIRRHSSSYFH